MDSIKEGQKGFPHSSINMTSGAFRAAAAAGKLGFCN
jgi:hypothetical protein